jgi:hypothetical protein
MKKRQSSGIGFTTGSSNVTDFPYSLFWEYSLA